MHIVVSAVGPHQKVDGVEVCWLPLQIAFILPNFIKGVLLFVEYQPIVSMVHCLDVCLQNKLQNLVFFCVQIEKILNEHLDFVLLVAALFLPPLHAELVVLYEQFSILDSVDEVQLHNVVAHVHHGVENQIT